MLKEVKNMDKRILFTTEKELLEAGAGLVGCYTEKAKSRKHCTDYIKKLKAYQQHMVKYDHNYVSIHELSRGKYRYAVHADCVEGFAKPGYRFTLEATEKMKDWLKDVTHKSDCVFSGDIAVPHAKFLSLEDALKFALLLLGLPVYNSHDKGRLTATETA
ncbi:MAG: hypothetical protein N5P05_004204 (plasmid) [Chroococcopsis gigantea SAG 12.99]|jgi:hypothetical protein|nr:hypothetical protein [Chroococcopsis gigantea SAG 12.99]